MFAVDASRGHAAPDNLTLPDEQHGVSASQTSPAGQAIHLNNNSKCILYD